MKYQVTISGLERFECIIDMLTKHQIQKQVAMLFQTKHEVCDKDIQGLAKQLGVAEPVLEEIVYGLLSSILYSPKDKRDLDNEEVRIGTKHEMEHTDNPIIARKIATDHVAERSDYYTILNRVMPD